MLHSGRFCDSWVEQTVECKITVNYCEVGISGMKKTRLPFGIRAARNAELNKGVLLIAFGYVFCYLFMLDYSVEGMGIFYRWSTTSYSQFQHPVLYAIWVILCGSAFFLNIGYLRGKYGATQRWLSVLQRTQGDGSPVLI